MQFLRYILTTWFSKSDTLSRPSLYLDTTFPCQSAFRTIRGIRQAIMSCRRTSNSTPSSHPILFGHLAKPGSIIELVLPLTEFPKHILKCFSHRVYYSVDNSSTSQLMNDVNSFVSTLSCWWWQDAATLLVCPLVEYCYRRRCGYHKSIRSFSRFAAFINLFVIVSIGASLSLTR